MHPTELTPLQVPLRFVGLDELADALRDLPGTASLATSCTIRIRVTSMLSHSSLTDLQAKGHDYVDCKFAAMGLLGQGMGKVQDCDLSKMLWDGTTGLNVTLQSIESPLTTGPDPAALSTLAVIDDFSAIGTLY